MHDGLFVDLESVLDFYRHPPDKQQGRQHELPELDITDAESRLLVQFLKSLAVVRD
jgi:hypothetical protein